MLKNLSFSHEAHLGLLEGSDRTHQHILHRFSTSFNFSDKILIGIEDNKKDKSILIKHLDKCGTIFKEESNNKAYLDFLK